MQGQVLYAPVLTPELRKAEEARCARLARIASRAVPEVVTDVQIAPSTAPSVEPEMKSGEELVAEWVERQKQAFKEPWFSIVDEVEPAEPRKPQIDEIQRAVAQHFQVTRDDINSSRRTANLVRPRQIAMYLAKTLTLRSLPEIGRRFGGRDHTTVLHAVRKIERQIETDAALAEDVTATKEILNGEAP